MPCPSCGEENPERARFCLNCGTPLGEAAAPGGEERKVVSVLFVDLVGFTAASDAADPEDVRARLRPYHAMLKKEIERFGGTVEKFIGDAVMAVFGAPVAHEDDAERGVRAALRITEAIPELNEQHRGLDLAVRAAVNTGEAVVALGAHPSEGEGIVTGDVVNTASRLQGVAPVGGVVVGENTHRATRDVVDYEALEPVTVKGKSEPLAIWRALAVRSRYGVDVERPHTPFVGREDDLALLEQAYTRTQKESSVQLVTIAGEPGVGKTRLVAEFHQWVDDRPEIVFWRQGRCLPYGDGITFWALGEIVKAQAGILESDTPEQAAVRLAEAIDLVADEKDRDWMKSRLGVLVGATADVTAATERAESFAAWRAFLEGVATVRPLILIIEDLHWADQAMLDFLEDLVDWSAEAPLLVVCTARPELYERSPGWGGGKRNSATLTLSPLSGEDTARLIAGLLDQAVLPAETQALVLERAGGNPLYTEEFIRMLIDRGILERRGPAWAVTAVGDIPVPESVQALIAARLDTLPPDRKAMLQNASVVGKVFWSGTVAAMGGVDEAAVRDALRELSRKELVRPARRSSVEDQAEYAFWHLLIRDVAYGQIPRAARAAKHRAAAEWIERMAGDRVADQAELLAHHYGDALTLAASAGSYSGIEDLRSRAVRFLVLAGERARSLDTSKAAWFLRRAVQLAEDGSLDQARALSELATVCWFLGEIEEGIRAGEEAQRLFETAGDEEGANEAKLTVASVLWQEGQTERSLKMTREIIEAMEHREPSPVLAEALVRASGSEMLAGNPRLALELGRRALPLTRQFGLADSEARALQFIGDTRCELGDLGGLDDLHEAVRMGVEMSLPLAPVAYVNLANWVWETEGPAQALDVYRKAIEYAESRSTTAALTWATGETTWVLLELGRWDELVAVADRLLENDRPRSQISSLCQPYKARVLFERGQVDAAATAMEDALERARAIDNPQVLLPAIEVATLIAHAQGDREAAMALVREFEDYTAGRQHWRPSYLPPLLRVLVDMGQTDMIERLLPASWIPAIRAETFLQACRAIVAEAMKDAEGALTLHREAASAWRTYGFPLEQGRALLGMARCLVALGPADKAQTPLLEARDIFATLGAAPLAAEADAWLERATALSS
jgi:class 3 adenylate cyclase/tetratricopeptide (TPR) repeat protein